MGRLALFRRTATARALTHGNIDPAPFQRLTQKHFDLGIGRAQFLRGKALHCIVERRIEPQGKGFLLNAGHMPSTGRVILH